MKLVDVPDSKSGEGDLVWVRVPPPAGRQKISAAFSQKKVEKAAVHHLQNSERDLSPELIEWEAEMFLKKLIFFLVLTFCCFFLLSAEEGVIRVPSVNGATGIITTPNALIGWKDAKVGIDCGYTFIFQRVGLVSHIPFVTLSLFDRVEFSSAFDIQGDGGFDFIINWKVKIFSKENSSLALGGNYQNIRYYPDPPNVVHAGQAYIAFTFSHSFFTWPAVTTFVLGKTFGEGYMDSNIDFSMGFELDFAPKAFKHHVFWINDFANYSYSIDPNGANPLHRAVYNTGFRILALNSKKFKLNFNVVMTDALDQERRFLMSACFGVGIKG